MADIRRPNHKTVQLLNPLLNQKQRQYNKEQYQSKIDNIE